MVLTSGRAKTFFDKVDTTIQTECKYHRHLLRHHLFLFLKIQTQLSLLTNIDSKISNISVYNTCAYI
jgi:hypothetical protein